MNFRKAQYNKDGTIDVEIEHPIFGWIPFTASPLDPEKIGRDLFELLRNSNEVSPFLSEDN